MTDASDYVRVIQKRTGKIIGSPEETAYHAGYINKEQFENLAKPLKKSGYGEYLLGLL
jgi:glucose-1-phosphate thymidylyltransferase